MIKYLVVIAVLMMGCADKEVFIGHRTVDLTVTTIPDGVWDGLLEVDKTGVAILNDDGEVVFITEYEAEQIIAANKTTTTICPNSSVELTGEIVDMGIDYSQITIDTSRILSICFDDRMHCYNTMQLKDYVAYKKEDK